MNSRTGVRSGLVTGPREPVEQERLQLGEPREVLGQPVARPADQRRSAAPRPGPASVRFQGGRRLDAHGPAPRWGGRASIVMGQVPRSIQGILDRGFQVGPGDPLLLLAGGEVAEVEHLACPPRRARRSPRACARATSRSPSACRSGSARGRPRRRCPRRAAVAASRTGIAGSTPGKFATSTGTVVDEPLEPAGLFHQRQQPVQPDRGADAGQAPRR